MIEMGWAGGRLAGPSRCPHRVVFGQGRVVHCRDGGEVTVSTSCVQFSDGSIDIGGLIETPAVQIDRRHSAAMLGNSRRQSSDPPLSRRGGCSDDHHRTPPHPAGGRSRAAVPSANRTGRALGHRYCSDEPFSSWTKAFTDPRLCAAIVDMLTFAGQITETGSASYRPVHARNARPAS